MTANDNTHVTPHDLLERIHKDREALAALWGGLTKGWKQTSTSGRKGCRLGSFPTHPPFHLG